jgi:hypothetical protein
MVVQKVLFCIRSIARKFVHFVYRGNAWGGLPCTNSKAVPPLNSKQSYIAENQTSTSNSPTYTHVLRMVDVLVTLSQAPDVVPALNMVRSKIIFAPDVITCIYVLERIRIFEWGTQALFPGTEVYSLTSSWFCWAMYLCISAYPTVDHESSITALGR